MLCRVCGGSTARIFHSAPRSIIGITKPIDAPLSVYLCESCSHGQSEDIDFARYYSDDYRFQLQSAEHDQLHSVVEGKPLYRADLQADIALKLVDIPKGAQVLDYGAAKASTLKKLCAARSDIVPSVFDVSDAYRSLWDEWIPRDRQASFNAPAEWSDKFDVILTFFVFEHVEKPNEILRELRRLLKPNGRLFILVPNPLKNISDFVVFEHVSHFTTSSLIRLLNQNGMTIFNYSADLFFGAHAILSQWSPGGVPTKTDIYQEIEAMHAAGKFWSDAQNRLLSAADNRPSAIYGAGVYGNYIATRIENRANLKCFIDRNPQLWGPSEFGIPIVGPENVPDDVEVVYAGVNPLRAREWLTDVPEWRGRKIETIYLD